MHSKLLLLGLAAQTAAPCYACVRGGAPERWMASVLAASIVLSHVALDHVHRFYRWEESVAIIDVAVLFAALLIAMLANRYWTVPFAALQAIIVIGHWAKRTNELILPSVYYGATGYVIYPLMLLLAIGTWRHRRRRSAAGGDPPWKPVLRI